MPERREPLTSPPLSLRASGKLACFTRPELKVERVSYPVITPSAARGLIEAVLWKPAIRWRVQSVAVLAPVRWTAFRRNEVSGRMSGPSRETLTDGGIAPSLLADDPANRAQRNTVALRDVDYLLTARFELTDRAGPGDNVNKFVDMFTRRVNRGQHFHQPYLGCREFPADVEPAAGAPGPVDLSRDLGLMLWDIDFAPGGARPRFFHAALENGVMHVPDDPEATLPAAASGDGGDLQSEPGGAA